MGWGTSTKAGFAAMAVFWKDLLQWVYSYRLGLGFLSISVCQVALVWMQVSNQTRSALAMSFFFVPNVLFISTLASLMLLGSVMDEREGGLFAFEITSPASRLGIVIGKMVHATVVGTVFTLPMIVALPVSRSVYGYYPMAKIMTGLGAALIAVLAYAWGSVALGYVLGRRNLSNAVLTLWVMATAWFSRTPFENVPRLVSVLIPADGVRLSVFKLFWEGSTFTYIEGIEIGHLLVWPLAIIGIAFLVTVGSLLVIGWRRDVS